MRILSSIAAIGAATFVFSGLTSAQTFETDYDFQWAPLSNGAQVGLSDNFLFSFGGALPVPHPAGPGDAIRRCYSVDVTQGGKNQSSGRYETTWFTASQGFAAANTNQGTDYGLVSIQAASESDLGGDACLSPFFASAGNTGGHTFAGGFIPGLQTGTAPFPFPAVWQTVFQWAGTTSGVFGPNTIGTDATNPFGAPLLANVIYEVQGPFALPGDHQYYLGTTDEATGDGLVSTPITGRGTGGVTNGNSAWGSSLFGVTADLSGAASHTRIFSFDPTAGTLNAGTAFWGARPSSAEVNNFVAFAQPFLWAENNGSVGAGGPDWNLSSGTPSTVQVWVTDICSGAQGTSNNQFKSAGPGVPTQIFSATDLLIVNQPLFFWSSTPALGMAQLPMSWDDQGGIIPPSQGSILFGTTETVREGLQLVPLTADILTFTMLGVPGLTNGTTYGNAQSLWYDPLPAALAGDEGIWEGAFGPVESGVAKLSIAGGTAFPVLSAPDPSFAGVAIGVASLGLQVRLIGGTTPQVDLTEFANALTINMQ